MTSSKLSGRRSTPKKPPICITKPYVMVWPSPFLTAHVWWISDPVYSAPMHIDCTVTLVQSESYPWFFDWTFPPPRMNRLHDITAHCPWDETYNYVELHAYDTDLVQHAAATWFKPPRPPPFTQDVSVFATKNFESDSLLVEFAAWTHQ